MKILHIYFGDYKEGNGIFTVLDVQLRWLGLQTKTISSSLLLNKDQEYVGSDYETFRYSTKSFKSIIQKGKYDLAIIHGFFFLDYIKISKELKSEGIPYLIKPHSSFTKRSWGKSYLKKKIAFYFAGLSKVVKNATGIIYINSEEQTNSYNFNKSTFIERNGLELPEKALSVKTIHHPIHISFFSRIDFNHKGIDILLKAVNQLKSESIHFDFWGIGSEKEVNKLQKYITDKKLNNVSYRGACFGDEKKKVFDNADILILTSRYEGFPTVFIEALLNGIPAIVSPGTNACFFHNQGIGWKCTLNPSEIANTIKSAIDEFGGGIIAIF